MRALLALAVLAAISSGWVVWRSPVVADPKVTGPVRALLALAVLLAATFVWRRRPASYFGRVLLAVAWLYAASALSAFPERPLFVLGRLALTASLVGLLYIALATPTGRLDPWGRRFIVTVGVATGLVWAGLVLVAPTLPDGYILSRCAQACPGNPFVAVHAHRLAGALGDGARWIQAVTMVALVLVVVLRVRRERRLPRRGTMIAFGGIAVAGGVLLLPLIWKQPSSEGKHLLEAGLALGVLALSLGIVATQRGSNAISGFALRRVVATAGDMTIGLDRVQALLQDVLGDPTLTLAVWDGGVGQYLSVSGEPVALPSHGEGRTVRRLVVDGALLGAVVHDPLLDDASGLAETIAAVSLILRARGEMNGEVQRALADAAETQTQDRLRIERDLHDGAVQRVLALRLEVARIRREAADPELDAQLEHVELQAGAIGDDLRRLATGIYPKTLVDRGLTEALQEAILESGDRVELVGDAGRLPAQIEQALYFCALEAVQNAVRHAGSWARVEVSLVRSARDVDLEVVDNGVGFDLDGVARGLGLASMGHRMFMVHGSLAIDTEPGRGTRVSGHIPLHVGGDPR